MPTKRTRRRIARAAIVAPEIYAWMSDETEAPAEQYFLLKGELEKCWSQCREEILARWITVHPGTRPLFWWKYDAPTNRKRIGGAGNPPWEAGLAHAPWFKRGVPRCEWVNYDPNDLPIFESEASYLLRHGLLADAEKRKLNANDFQPEAHEFLPMADFRKPLKGANDAKVKPAADAGTNSGTGVSTPLSLQ